MKKQREQYHENSARRDAGKYQANLLKLAREFKHSHGYNKLGSAIELGQFVALRLEIELPINKRESYALLNLHQDTIKRRMGGGLFSQDIKPKKKVKSKNLPLAGDNVAWPPVDRKTAQKIASYDSVIRKRQSNDFYRSPEWRNVRYGIIEKHKGKCCACGQSHKEHGVVMHVDHIKPRSKFPELELEPSNLQLLCENCNVAKSNHYQTDWR